MILQRIIESPYSKKARVLELGKQYGYCQDHIILLMPLHWCDTAISFMPEQRDKDNPRTYGNGKYLLQWGFRYEGKEYWEDDINEYHGRIDIMQFNHSSFGCLVVPDAFDCLCDDFKLLGNLALNPELKSKLER